MIVAAIAIILLVGAMGWALVHHGKRLDELDEIDQTSDPAPHPDADEAEWRVWKDRQLKNRGSDEENVPRVDPENGWLRR